MKTKTKHWASITAGILSLAGYTSASSLGSEKYTYDASGNIIEKFVNGTITKMSYDKSNRIVGKQVIGQVSEATSYDAAGHQIIESNEEGRTVRKLTYGFADKVLQVTDRVSDAQFYYNAEGQLVGKLIKSELEVFTWDNLAMVARGGDLYCNESHRVGGVPLLNNSNVIVSDHLGTTLRSGTTEFFSTAYGEGLLDAFFTGKLYVQELGGFAFLNRTFMPETGRWLTLDPSGFPDGTNRFAYVNGDPIVMVDPMGLDMRKGMAGGELTNNTYCDGPGWDVVFSADGRRTVYNWQGVSGAPFSVTYDDYDWDSADATEAFVSALVAADPTTRSFTQAWTGATNFTLAAHKNSWDDLNIEDADHIESSPHPISIWWCGGPATSLSPHYHIGASDEWAFEN